MDNEGLKEVYDSMHQQGPSAWFGQGDEERQLILEMGDPWHGKNVLEIGCGEGELADTMSSVAKWVTAIDYSDTAIRKAKEKQKRKLEKPRENLRFISTGYRSFSFESQASRLVMQGVLEHLDNPFTELKWMIDNLLAEKSDVITSSPCFLNPRGIVWMTLDMLGAVISKTDLHFLNPWQFEDFASEHGYKLVTGYCDSSWGRGQRMIEDLKKRIPLALKDGNIPFKQENVDNFLQWLEKASTFTISPGAIAVYKISK